MLLLLLVHVAFPRHKQLKKHEGSSPNYFTPYIKRI